MSTLTVGPVVETPPKPHPKTQRSPDEWSEWKGEPPQHDGKFSKVYEITERCGFKEEDKDYKKGKPCEIKQRVIRVFNTKFQRGEYGFDGQLMYDENDVKQYKYCPKHGPHPPGPETW